MAEGLFLAAGALLFILSRALTTGKQTSAQDDSKRGDENRGGTDVDTAKPPTAEEIERKRAQAKVELEALKAKANLQLEAEQKNHEQWAELQRKVEQLQSQQDAMPLDALIDTVKFMAGVMPGVSSSIDLVECAQANDEARKLREEAEFEAKQGQKQKAEELQKQAKEKEELARIKMLRVIPDALPGVSTVMTLYDAVTYDPWKKLVTCEVSKAVAEKAQLERQLAAAKQTMDKMSEELDPDDPVVVESRKSYEQFATEAKTQIENRDKQVQEWAKAVTSAAKARQYDQEHPETVDLPELAEYGNAHEKSGPLMIRSLEIGKELGKHLRDSYQSEMDEINSKAPPSDVPDDDPERQLPPERRSLDYYRKQKPTASPSELQKLRLADVEQARRKRDEAHREREREANRKRASKRQAMLDAMEERRIEALGTRVDLEAAREMTTQELREHLDTEKETVDDMRKTGSSEQDIRQIQQSYQNFRGVYDRRQREERTRDDSASQDSGSSWTPELSELGKRVDLEAAREMTTDELREHLDTEKETIEDMRRVGSSEEDIQHVAESFQNFRDEYEQRNQ
jgi:hypothetical protein